jgi:hypothetical protein
MYPISRKMIKPLENGLISSIFELQLFVFITLRINFLAPSTVRISEKMFIETVKKKILEIRRCGRGKTFVSQRTRSAAEHTRG